MSFGKRLKELRINKRITQFELAHFLNKSRSTIAGYEINDRMPDFDTLINISKYFNVSVDYLLGISDNPNKTETIPANIPDRLKELGFEYIALAEDIKRSELTPDEIKELIEFAKKMKQNNKKTTE